MSYPPAQARSRAPWLAALLVPLLALGATLAPAGAALAEPVATPTVTATVTAASETDGLTVGLAGTGFDGITGGYAAIIEKGTEAAVGPAGGYAAFGFWMPPAGGITDGTFDRTLTVPTASLDATKAYEFLIWQGHTAPTAATIYARVDISVTSTQWDAIFPPPAPVPTVTATVTAASETDGLTVGLTGTGFDGITGGYAAIIEKGTEAAVGPAGGYAAFGFWMPPAGGITDGAFDRSLTVPTASLDRTKAYEFLIWQGHTAPTAATIYARVDITVSANQWNAIFPPALPTFGITVTPTADVTDGGTVTVTGTFPATITATKGATSGSELVTGVYVMYCDAPTGTVGTAGGRLSGPACDGTQQKYLVSSAGPAGGTVAGSVTDGVWTFSTELTVSERTGASGIFTRLYHGFNAGNVADPYVHDQFVGLSFAEPTPEPTPEPRPDPEPVTPPAAVSAGSLSWGVKAAFRSYVTGPIAAGSISTTGASSVLGSIMFPQSEAAALTGGLGTVSFSGSVRFTGHGGALDMRLTDPQLRLDSASSGTLLVRVNGGSRIAFATVNLGAASRTVAADGSIRYSGAPATLTAAGSTGFNGFYAAGESLDPVSFTIGSVGSAPRGTVTIASAARTASGNTPDATPPATTGVTITGAPIAGAEITATADGFTPGETGILAVIYSTPTVLAEGLTADAAGRVSWTGALPLTLTGTHTFTFQGSVDRGAVIEIAATASELVCTVVDARLEWGVKEAFRAYIDGSIANGEWTTAGNASYATPLFTWAAGTGGADLEQGALAVQFTGDVRFTGHGGILDTTIGNPRIVVDGDRAVLLLDVTGTTQEGEVVADAAVEFAELELGEVTPTREGDIVTWAGIPAKLTAAGSDAFGTYPAGESLDPLTIVATVDSACDSAAAPAPSPETTDDAVAAPQPNASEWPLWATVVIAVAVLLLIAGLVIVLLRRKNAA